MPTRALNLHDYLAAAAPVLGSITLAEVNTVAQIVGAALGAAYLVWKWRREARAGREVQSEFPLK
jgi:hypothetical protein